MMSDIGNTYGSWLQGKASIDLCYNKKRMAQLIGYKKERKDEALMCFLDRSKKMCCCNTYCHFRTIHIHN